MLTSRCGICCQKVGDNPGFFWGYEGINYCHIPKMLKKGKEVSY